MACLLLRLVPGINALPHSSLLSAS